MDTLTYFDLVLPGSGLYALFSTTANRHYWTGTQTQLAHWAANMANTDTGLYVAMGSFRDRKRSQANADLKRCLYVDIDCGPEKHATRPNHTYPDRKAAIEALRAFVKATKLPPSLVVASGTHGLYAIWCFNEDVPVHRWQPAADHLKTICHEQGFKADPAVTADSARILRPLGAIRDDGAVVKLATDTGVRWDFADLAERLKALAPHDPFEGFEVRGGRDVNADIEDSLVVSAPRSLARAAERCETLRWIGARQGDVGYAPWWHMIGVAKHCIDGESIVHDFSRGHPGYDADEVNRKLASWSTGPTTCAQFQSDDNRCDGCPHSVTSPIQLGSIPMDDMPEEVRESAEEAVQAQADAEHERAVEGAEAPWHGRIRSDNFLLKRVKGELAIHGKVEVPDKSTPGAVTTLFVPVTQDIFWLDSWCRSDTTSAALVMVRYVDENNEVRAFEMSQTVLADTNATLKELATHSIHTLPGVKARQLMVDYVKEQLIMIRKSGLRPKISGRLGTRVLTDGTTVSAAGRHIIYGDGHIQEGLCAGGLADIAEYTYKVNLPASNTGEWAPSVWPEHLVPAARRHVEFIRQYFHDKPKHLLAMMLGMASPLLAYTTTSIISGSALPPTGITVALHSDESARFKTASMQHVALAYGSTVVRDGNKAGTTDIARLTRLALAGTLPVIFDEMEKLARESRGALSAEVLAELISIIANGTGRERATRDGGLQMGSTWALVAMMGSNRDMRELILQAQSQSNAIQMRLIEINVDGTPAASKALQDEYAAGMQEIMAQCQGALGAIIQRAVVQMGPENGGKFCAKYVSEAADLVENNQAYRFQFRAMGAALALQAVLEHIGLAFTDKDTLVQTFKDTTKSLDDVEDDYQQRNTPVEVLTDMVSDLAPYTLITDTLSAEGSKIPMVLNIQGPPREIKARIVKRHGLMFVNAGTMSEWLGNNNLSKRNIHERFEEVLVKGDYAPPAGRAKRESTRRKFEFIHRIDLQRGLRSSTHRVNAYCIDLAKLWAATGGSMEDAPDWVRQDNVQELREGALA